MNQNLALKSQKEKQNEEKDFESVIRGADFVFRSLPDGSAEQNVDRSFS